MTDNTSKEIATLEKQFTPLVLKAGKLVITSKKEQDAAGKMLTELQGYAKKLKDRKEEITKPLNTALKSARELFKGPEEKVLEAIEAIRSGMGTYQLEQEREAQAKQDKIAARVGEGKGHYSAETASKKMAEVEAPGAVVNDGGIVKFRTDIKLEITGYDAVMNHIAANRLMDLVELDQTALLKWIKAGNEVPGAVLKEVKTPITTLAK